MYISCPKCDTKFVLTSEEIGKNGRKVKCSKCFNIWHQNNSEIHKEPILANIKPQIKENLTYDSQNSTTNTPIGNGINLPALLPTKITDYLLIMPIIMIGLIIMTITLLYDNTSFKPLINNSNLIIKDVQITKNINKITVNYKIHNTSITNNKKIPMIRVRLFDKNKKLLKSTIDDRTNINISPDQSIQIKTEFAPAPKSTDNIDIMVGNKIDFILH